MVATATRSARRAGARGAAAGGAERASGTTSASAGTTEAALDEALERIGELAYRLWAVRERHSPARTWLGRSRCRCCGHLYPCETVQVTGLPLDVTRR